VPVALLSTAIGSAVFERHLYAVLSQLDNPRDKQSGAVVEEIILFPGSKAREYWVTV